MSVHPVALVCCDACDSNSVHVDGSPEAARSAATVLGWEMNGLRDICPACRLAATGSSTGDGDEIPTAGERPRHGRPS